MRHPPLLTDWPQADFERENKAQDDACLAEVGSQYYAVSKYFSLDLWYNELAYYGLNGD